MGRYYVNYGGPGQHRKLTKQSTEKSNSRVFPLCAVKWCLPYPFTNICMIYLLSLCLNCTKRNHSQNAELIVHKLTGNSVVLVRKIAQFFKICRTLPCLVPSCSYFSSGCAEEFGAILMPEPGGCACVLLSRKE